MNGSIKQNKFLLLGLLAALLAALALSVLLPSGVEDVSFEYTARFDGLLYDGLGKTSALHVTLLPPKEGDAYIALHTGRGMRIITENSKLHATRIPAGATLYLSVASETETPEGVPLLLCDVIFVVPAPGG